MKSGVSFKQLTRDKNLGIHCFCQGKRNWDVSKTWKKTLRTKLEGGRIERERRKGSLLSTTKLSLLRHKGERENRFWISEKNWSTKRDKDR